MFHADDITRRQFVQSGSVGLLGMGLAAGLSERSAAAAITSPAVKLGKAKSVMILFLYGAPSQMDTLDPKPDAPEEVRGEFKAIRTGMPGVLASEHLPNIAKNLHRVCLLRSMTHTSSNHAVSVALSGLRESLPEIEGNGNDPRHQPYFGSVLEYLWRQQGVRQETAGVPLNMVLPWALNNKTDRGRWQHHAAWLGKSYNPITPAFHGSGSREIGSPSINGSTPILTRFDPWDGVTTASSFTFDGTALPPDIPAARFDARRKLLSLVEGAAMRGDRQAFDQCRDHALSLITNPALARVLDVTKEPERLRERYGMNLFAQSVLAGRRLIEAGVRVVTVFWDTWTDNNAAWDTHHNHHPRLKDGLCPKLDQVLPAFLDDMTTRGLLDDTLVMVISEHGRTPTITRTAGGGREHWAGAYWGMFFGAGIKTGQVIGATDRQGGFPISHPTHPNDILATAYYLLGFDPHVTIIPDRTGRPIRLTEGTVVRELLA